MDKNGFPQTERSQLRRLPERGSHDRDDVYAILDAGLVCHVGFVMDGRPFVIPMAYGRVGDSLYLHGGLNSRLMRAMEGMEICVTVTMVDGIVLARSNFHSSMNYRSVVAFGGTRILTDRGEQDAALAAIVEQLAPGRAAETRPSSKQEVGATHVVEFTMVEATAKVRTGPPSEPEADWNDPVWAGVVPLTMNPGEPIPAENLDPRHEASEVVIGWPGKAL